MFGADTPLVFDALQMAAIIAAGAGGIVYLLMRRRKQSQGDNPSKPKADNLEQRVQVLERIATDRSIDLADEIEGLRDAPSPAATGKQEASS